MQRRLPADLCLAIGLLMFILAPGCNPFDPPPAPPDPGLGDIIDRSSRDNLMEFFARAHESREIDKYAECLHPLFTFWFWEDEPVIVFPNPWIDRSEDIGVTKNMFDAASVTSISMTLTNLVMNGDDGNWWMDQVNVGGVVTTVWWAEFQVDLHVVVDEGEQAVDRWVNGKADIHVMPDPEYIEEGYWTIVKIKDRTAEHKGSAVAWSSVKGPFR